MVVQDMILIQPTCVQGQTGLLSHNDCPAAPSNADLGLQCEIPTPAYPWKVVKPWFMPYEGWVLEPVPSYSGYRASVLPGKAPGQ